MGEICGRITSHLHDVIHAGALGVCRLQRPSQRPARVGDPQTELAKDLIRTGAYLEHDFVANYEGRTRGGKRFVSSTYFIKEKGELVGLICVNHDVEDFFALSEHLNNLVQAFSLPVGGTYPTTYTENLDDSISGLSSSLIHSTVLNYHVPMEAMHSADKLEVVRILESQGVFATKGSVGQVARELHISEPTVYRYLQKIRNGKV